MCAPRRGSGHAQLMSVATRLLLYTQCGHRRWSDVLVQGTPSIPDVCAGQPTAAVCFSDDAAAHAPGTHHIECCAVSTLMRGCTWGACHDRMRSLIRTREAAPPRTSPSPLRSCVCSRWVVLAMQKCFAKTTFEFGQCNAL
jgi:hypothetical protein